MFCQARRKQCGMAAVAAPKICRKREREKEKGWKKVRKEEKEKREEKKGRKGEESKNENVIWV